MKSTNELVLEENGWLVLIGNIKYGNTPIISKSRIIDFTYYTSTDSEDEPKHYINFKSSSSQGSMWQFNSKKDLQEVYSDLKNLLLGREEI